jgi:glycosyltransferase involved in cell wall biosynthesis
MRIAIDARELGGHLTGVGRYLLQVLQAMRGMPEAVPHEFVLCTDAPLDVRLEPLRVSVVTRRTRRGALWTQLTLPRLVSETRADVLFAPAYESPIFCRAPTVLSVHDVSFCAHPEWFSTREGLRRRLLTRASARRATTILTFSEFSKQEIVRHLRVDLGRVTVTYHGITHFRDIPKVSSDPNVSNVPNAPNVLFVGSIFNRRHVPELIDGFGRLASRRPGAALHIVGANRSRPYQDLEALAAAQSPARVYVRSYVTDAELGALYGQARAFVFLSDYEGFGMTPLEALAAGVPILVLDTPVAREIYGEAALYIPRPEPALIESALEHLLWDEAARARILAAAAGILQRYSWDTCARLTLRALLRAPA